MSNTSHLSLVIPALFFFFACATSNGPSPASTAHTVQVLSESGKSLLAEVVDQERPIVDRRRALEALAASGEQAAVVPLAALMDGNEGTAVLMDDILQALQRLDYPSVLVSMLRGSPHDRKLSAELLQVVPTASAFEPLVSCLDDASPEIRVEGAGVCVRNV